ncbi:hypothetical protein [Serratia sp. CY37869]|uniref:hypothetical protein n=1 Tax=Serratia sp. CY37869 TaxID=3383612 RepID=UPI003F9F290F
MALTTEKLNSSDEQICDGDSAETIEENPKSWAAWKREAERLQAIIDANREAQPVAFYGSNGAYYNTSKAAIKDGCEDVTPLYTAPPAPAVVNGRTAEGWMAEALLQKSVADALRKSLPAVPEEAKLGEMPFLGNSEPGYVRGWNNCRAAMLAQPVSGGYKLVPAEATEDMIAAAMNCDDVSFNADETFCVNFGNIYAAMLSAAPEGGNG